MEPNLQLLYDAAVENKVETLLELIIKDPKVLEKASLSCEDKNPLHISAMFGNLEFVRQVLRLCPEMCLAGDRLGRTPLHLAVIGGKSEVVAELIRARPLAARERIAGGGGNVLHLCVRSNQLDALKCVVQNIDDGDFLNHKDDDGMTILHLAVLDKKIETIKFLSSILQVNAKNANGRTPLDLVQGKNNSEITHILQHAGAKRSQEEDSSVSGNNPKWLYRKRDAIMVVASLIATMAFQVGVNPPGGVWQEDKPEHNAGTAAMANPPGGRQCRNRRDGIQAPKALHPFHDCKHGGLRFVPQHNPVPDQRFAVPEQVVSVGSDGHHVAHHHRHSFYLRHRNREFDARGTLTAGERSDWVRGHGLVRGYVALAAGEHSSVDY